MKQLFPNKIISEDNEGEKMNSSYCHYVMKIYSCRPPTVMNSVNMKKIYSCRPPTVINSNNMKGSTVVYYLINQALAFLCDLINDAAPNCENYKYICKYY